ncbi:hypothetical protein [Methylocapsa sp. S129]|uniref:hypothetical protein n=1 Tax=Methylocapsa sp. S129 TaxID=1641869 RepID=UPI00131BC74F|nr:hypothetical protein [Methylocapsa sp. S129]
MTKKVMKDWNPERDLTALLDGLTAELLAASDQDIGAWAREEGAKSHPAARATRRVVKTAVEADLDAPPVSHFIVPGARLPFTRNQ